MDIWRLGQWPESPKSHCVYDAWLIVPYSTSESATSNSEDAVLTFFYIVALKATSTYPALLPV